MPSLMATLGLDASNFNQNAEKVVAKARETGNRISKATNKGGTLASDPNAFFKNLDKKPVSRVDSIKREAEEAKRMDLLAKDRAADWRAQERAQMAQFRAAQANEKLRQREIAATAAAGRREGLAAKRLNKEIFADAKAAVPKASALGGVGKMFAGYMTADFIAGQTRELINYANTVTRLSKSLNVSTDDFQAWHKVAGQYQMDEKDVGSLFEKINKNRINALSGNEPLQGKAFKQLGITDEMLKTMSTSDLTLQIAKAFESGQNTEVLTAALMRVGEESAFQFTQAFQEGIGSKIQAVKESGDIMSATVIASLRMIGDQWQGIASSLFSGFGQAAAPVLKIITDQVESNFDRIKTASAVIGGLFGGGVQGAKDALSERQKALDKRDEDRKKKLEDASKPTGQNVNIELANKNVEAAKLKAQKDEDALKKQAQRETDREMRENAQLGRHSTNALQQQGGFLGNYAMAAGPEVAAMNAQVRSEGHLREILSELRKKKTSATEETEY